MGKTYKERQDECGLKVRDKVKILREAVGFEDGWDNAWIPRMSECVGDTGVIGDMYGALGVRVKTDNYGTYFFPYFVLEKVEENETPKQPEPVKPEEKKLTRYSVFTMRDQGKDFFLIPATSKEETSESIIFSEKSGGTWEFYKKHIIAIKTL